MKVLVHATVTAPNIDLMNDAIRETRNALAQGRACMRIDVEGPIQVTEWQEITGDANVIERRIKEVEVEVTFTFEAKAETDWAVGR